MTVDRLDVIALLEDGPQHQTDLVSWLGAPEATVKATLWAMRREGQLKQVGTAQQWALVSFIAETGRRPTLDRDAIRTAILAAVTGGPTPTQAVVDASGFSRTTVKAELEALLAGGQLQHMGVGRGAKWALAAWVAPVVDDVDEAIASEVEALEDVDAADDDDDEEEDLPPPQRERGQRRLYPAGTRQTVKAQTAKTADEPGWWVGLDRDTFTAVAQQRAETMRTAKENRLVPVRILQ